MTGAVRLSLPAEAEFAVVARTIAMTMATQATLNGDRTQDARLLVDEIFHALMAAAEAAGEIHYEFHAVPKTLSLSARVTPRADAALDGDSTQWRVLTALASHITSRMEDGEFRITATVVDHE